jgi:hypothetical protein
VGKKITAVGALSTERVKTHPVPSLSQKNQRGRRPRKELQINCGINPEHPDTPNCLKGVDGRLDKSIGADGNDVFKRYEFHGIEDKAVLFEDQEVNVIPSNEIGSPTDC